jgi:DNA-binding HxlR family transcriptional regulator
MDIEVTSAGHIKETTKILGDKWTPLLLHCFISNEIVRFCQIQNLVGGINPRTLSARLVSLEEQGIIQKLPQHKSSRCDYTLTSKGRALMPILRGMEDWSKTYSSSQAAI